MGQPGRMIRNVKITGIKLSLWQTKWPYVMTHSADIFFTIELSKMSTKYELKFE